jgi:hypothetical protein
MQPKQPVQVRMPTMIFYRDGGEWKPIMPNLKSLELHGGVSLSYVEQGGALGIPMLLLHGATDS